MNSPIEELAAAWKQDQADQERPKRRDGIQIGVAPDSTWWDATGLSDRAPARTVREYWLRMIDAILARVDPQVLQAAWSEYRPEFIAGLTQVPGIVQVREMPGNILLVVRNTEV